jgi:hypothetical protein
MRPKLLPGFPVPWVLILHTNLNPKYNINNNNSAWEIKAQSAGKRTDDTRQSGQDLESLGTVARDAQSMKCAMEHSCSMAMLGQPHIASIMDQSHLLTSPKMRYRNPGPDTSIGVLENQ